MVRVHSTYRRYIASYRKPSSCQSIATPQSRKRMLQTKTPERKRRKCPGNVESSRRIGLVVSVHALLIFVQTFVFTDSFLIRPSFSFQLVHKNPFKSCYRTSLIRPHAAGSATQSSTPHREQKNKLSRQEIKRKFKRAQELERKGQWRKASVILEEILERNPSDSHSYLALARLEARRNPNSEVQARLTFERGFKACPSSVHLLQAWAVFEESKGNFKKAVELFEKALELDSHNPYVCHAYGLLERKLGNIDRARGLWNHALKKRSTAALVCQLGESMISENQLEKTRELYQNNISRIRSSREKTEVFLAYAWLEEHYFSNYRKAEHLIEQSLVCNPGSALAKVALARLLGRRQGKGKQAATTTIRRLATLCISESEKGTKESNDGRLFNTWASMEAKNKKFTSARRILERGILEHPDDHTLLHAAGKMEERMGNFTGARELYGSSLRVQPAAPTLVSLALLELKRPEPSDKQIDMARVRGLFDEALMIDPKHGPAYNSYGSLEFRSGNVEKAREIFNSGVDANCSDAASVYHGFAKMELAVGNVTRARELLEAGLDRSRVALSITDSPKKERAAFLIHTLGMLELNSNSPSKALEVFTEGLRMCGNSSQLLLGVAMSEVKLGNEEKARHFFERAVLADEAHAQAWQAWAVMEARGGNWNVAKTLFESGLRNSPKHAPLWLNYAIGEGRLGSTEVARRLFTQGLEQSPNHAPMYQFWAQLEMKDENYSSAKLLIAEALTRDKTCGQAWLMAAEIERKLGNDGLHELLLRRGIQYAPTDTGLYRALGASLAQKWKYSEARAVYEQGLSIDPMNAPLYHSLAELEAQLFNLDGLAELNKRAIKIFKTDATKRSTEGEEAWGISIRANRAKALPKHIIDLTKKIAADDSSSPLAVHDESYDPDLFIDKLSRKLLEDRGPVSDILQLDKME